MKFMHIIYMLEIFVFGGNDTIKFLNISMRAPRINSLSVYNIRLKAGT